MGRYCWWLQVSKSLPGYYRLPKWYYGHHKQWKVAIKLGRSIAWHCLSACSIACITPRWTGPWCQTAFPTFQTLGASRLRSINSRWEALELSHHPGGSGSACPGAGRILYQAGTSVIWIVIEFPNQWSLIRWLSLKELVWELQSDHQSLWP